MPTELFLVPALCLVKKRRVVETFAHTRNPAHKTQRIYTRPHLTAETRLTIGHGNFRESKKNTQEVKLKKYLDVSLSPPQNIIFPKKTSFRFTYPTFNLAMGQLSTHTEGQRATCR